MASARVKIEVDGKPYELYFGMASTRIFQEMSAKEYVRLQEEGIENPSNEDFDPNKLFAIMVHSGLCNMSDVLDIQRPSFSDSYFISEEISKDDALTDIINNAWQESQPVKEMLDRLTGIIDTEKKNQKKRTGKKLKPLPLGS